MILYNDFKTQLCYYDTTMLSGILNLSKSKLNRILSEFKPNEKDFIKYKNRYLYKEEMVIRFVDFLTDRETIIGFYPKDKKQ